MIDRNESGGGGATMQTGGAGKFGPTLRKLARQHTDGIANDCDTALIGSRGEGFVHCMPEDNAASRKKK